MLTYVGVANAAMSSFHLRMKTCFENQLVQQTSQNNVKLCWTYHSKYDHINRCAVLCCLRETADGQVLVLITTRSDMLSSHPGDPCFPGGKEELFDHCIEDTALREAEEEINLKREDVNIVTVLPPVMAVSRTGYGLQCHFVVATLNTNNLELQSNSEVDGIYWVPLKLFLGEDEYLGCSLPYLGTHVYVDYFNINNQSNNPIVCWGFTSKWCMLIASIVYSCPPHVSFSLSFVDSLDCNKLNVCSFLLPNINNTVLISKI